MSAPRRILCPTDFSPCAERALQMAIAWSRESGAELEVLHVVPEGESGGSVLDAGLALERLLDRHQAERETIQVVARARSTARGIVDHARDIRADLIVLGTHGQKGFRSLLVGSVAEEVVRTAPCAVLAVPPRPLRASGRPRRALVPLDFGPRAAAALRYAKELVAPDGGLVLLHVIEATVAPDFYYPLARNLFLREPDARWRSAAALERLYWEVDGPDVPFEVRVVDGRAGADIPRIAAEVEADVVVMPTHGFATRERLALGSTTDKVLRAAPCPVLVHCPRRASKAPGPVERGRRALTVG